MDRNARDALTLRRGAQVLQERSTDPTVTPGQRVFARQYAPELTFAADTLDTTVTIDPTADSIPTWIVVRDAAEVLRDRWLDRRDLADALDQIRREIPSTERLDLRLQNQNMYLVYAYPNGRRVSQLYSEVPTVGGLIDEETGEDLEQVGWSLVEITDPTPEEGNA